MVEYQTRGWELTRPTHLPITTGNDGLRGKSLLWQTKTLSTLSQKSATVAENGETTATVSQSHFSATVWTGFNGSSTLASKSKSTKSRRRLFVDFRPIWYVVYAVGIVAGCMPVLWQVTLKCSLLKLSFFSFFLYSFSGFICVCVLWFFQTPLVWADVLRWHRAVSLSSTSFYHCRRLHCRWSGLGWTTAVSTFINAIQTAVSAGV